jgi:hypothetical protein
MCMGSAPADNSAEISRKNQAARGRRVSEGTSRINETFGKFDDSYYSGLGKSYLDCFKPQLERQHSEGQKQLTFRFADSGSLDPAASNQKFADLRREYTLQSSQLSNRALSAQQEGRVDVERNRADLIGQLKHRAGAESSGNSALARQQPQCSPAVFAPWRHVLFDYRGAGDVEGASRPRHGGRADHAPARAPGSVMSGNCGHSIDADAYHPVSSYRRRNRCKALAGALLCAC